MYAGAAMLITRVIIVFASSIVKEQNDLINLACYKVPDHIFVILLFPKDLQELFVLHSLVLSGG